MKKTIFSVIFTMTLGIVMGSCGNKTVTNDQTDSTSVDTTVVDSTVVDSASVK